MRKGRLGEKEAALFSPPYPAERPAARRKIPRRNKSMTPPLSRGIFYMKKARQPPRLFRILYRTISHLFYIFFGARSLTRPTP